MMKDWWMMMVVGQFGRCTAHGLAQRPRAKLQRGTGRGPLPRYISHAPQALPWSRGLGGRRQRWDPLPWPSPRRGRAPIKSTESGPTAWPSVD
eukprot:1367108-Pyramimonas_sp.AAC.1